MCTVIIIDQPNRQRDSLQAVLLAIPGINHVLTGENTDALRQLATAHPSALVILNVDHTGDAINEWIGWLRLHVPHCRVVVLSHKSHETLSGAWATLPDGFSFSELTHIIQQWQQEQTS